MAAGLLQAPVAAYISAMKRLLILLSLALTLSGPAMAQDGGDRPRGGLEGFLDDLRGGMDDALSDLQGWAETFGPAMRSFIDEMGPALTDMMDEVKDWSRYETPEMLPNGDIIIRRRTEDEGVPPIEDMPQGEEIEI